MAERNEYDDFFVGSPAQAPAATKAESPATSAARPEANDYDTFFQKPSAPQPQESIPLYKDIYNTAIGPNGDIGKAWDKAGVSPDMANLGTGLAFGVMNAASPALSTKGTSLASAAENYENTQKALRNARSDLPVLQNTSGDVFKDWTDSFEKHNENTKKLNQSQDFLNRIDAQIEELKNPKIGPATTPSGIKVEPISRAAANYGEPHGLYTAQKNIAVDTTKQPGGVWDYLNQNRQGFVKAEDVAPGYRSAPGTELAQSPSDLAAHDEATAKKISDLQKLREKAQTQHEEIQKNHTISQKSLDLKSNILDKLYPNAAEQKSTIDMLQERIKPYLNNPVARFGLNRLSRTLPFTSGFNIERNAEQAKKDWETGNYGQSATHAVGALGALASASSPTVAAFGAEPIAAGLAGIGSIAQTPAALLDTYNFYKRMNQPVTPKP